jgi:hypothetical protein
VRCLIVLPAALLLTPPSGATEPAADPLARAMQAAGVAERDLQPDPARLFTTPASLQRPPLLAGILLDPAKAAYRVGMLETAFRARLDSPHRLYMNTASLTGAEISRGYIGNPLAPVDRVLAGQDDPLAVMLAALDELAPPPSPTTVPDMAALPNPLRREIARLLGAVHSAERFRRRALRRLPADFTAARLAATITANESIPFDAPDFRLLLDDVEWPALHAGMLDLAAAAEDFVDYLASTDNPGTVEVSFPTALGTVVIRTSATNDTHETAGVLLLIDLAGDDVYTRSSDMHQPIQLLFDAAGNDVWRSTVTPGIGGAVMGYTLGWDGAGNDAHEGGALAHGAALFGGALWWDAAGDDRSAISSHGQGWALGGAALLLDLGGDDTRTATAYAQGSGGPRGAAVLLDDGGNDVYTLGAGELIFPSTQSPRHNQSMGQGMGYGTRADLGDGRSTVGGTGLLFDTAGDDVYTATVFAQGAGFLEGVGALVDGGGNDTRTGEWYVMAAAAHRAAGVLVDRGAGDDVYTAAQFTSLAAGHDLSVAMLVDEGGADRYTLGNLGLGAGHDNGIGLFVDVGGDDVYTLRQRQGFGAGTITQWGTRREDAPSIGLFFDLGGNDRHETRLTGPANNALWSWQRRHPAFALRSEAGAGIDGEYPNTFPTAPLTNPTGEDDKLLEDTRRARRAYRQTPTP